MRRDRPGGHERSWKMKTREKKVKSDESRQEKRNEVLQETTEILAHKWKSKYLRNNATQNKKMMEFNFKEKCVTRTGWSTL